MSVAAKCYGFKTGWLAQNALAFVAVIRTIHATHTLNIRACWREKQ
ncbi:hypothetical protein BN137_2617 [Cronobacter condimenti 1330]|uniref:Uncharacterized protein n=1 Tax=Cronobacter condimenti 1330 TaxID=1073999 RepID=K8A1F5_9ENTR|nr:hypothetical protein BN137_2617 [Cronobacter condimenti 1330]